MRAYLFVLVLALSGCGSDSSRTPLGPGPVPPQATVPSPPVPTSPGNWLDGYTLTAASLSGVVFESTPGGRVPISGAVVYCELCGEGTHTFAIADSDGMYLFPGDVTKGGGVWLNGQRTPVTVRGSGFSEDTWLGRSLLVLIHGDTRLDVELVRR